MQFFYDFYFKTLMDREWLTTNDGWLIYLYKETLCKV